MAGSTDAMEYSHNPELANRRQEKQGSSSTVESGVITQHRKSLKSTPVAYRIRGDLTSMTTVRVL